jgi:hypothetical protein
MQAKQKRIRVEELQKISVNEIVYSGSWNRKIGNTTIELIHDDGGIKLLVDGYPQPICWKIYERAIGGRLRNGGYVPFDHCWDYYIWSNDRRRWKFLYLMCLPDNRFRIGTRGDFGALYTSSCRSKYQRKPYQEGLVISLSKGKREKKIAWRDELKKRKSMPKNIVKNAG